ncbi:MAG: NUDIX domain-containing protein [Parachlamydiaceae bacterium]
MVQPNFVAGYIVDSTSQSEPLFLLLRRSFESYLPGIWQMVTGKLNQDESASSAIRREIFEETGLVCKDIYNVDVTMFYDQSKKSIAFSANFCTFANCTQPITIASNEHDQYRWCTLSESLELLAFPSQKETLQFIHKWFVLKNIHSVNLSKEVY